MWVTKKPQTRIPSRVATMTVGMLIYTSIIIIKTDAGCALHIRKCKLPNMGGCKLPNMGGTSKPLLLKFILQWWMLRKVVKAVFQ